MKNPKILSLIFLITSCTSPATFLTDHKDGWFRDPQFGLIYCKANLQSDGSADPVCTEAGFLREGKK